MVLFFVRFKRDNALVFHVVIEVLEFTSAEINREINQHLKIPHKHYFKEEMNRVDKHFDNLLLLMILKIVLVRYGDFKEPFSFIHQNQFLGQIVLLK